MSRTRSITIASLAALALFACSGPPPSAHKKATVPGIEVRLSDPGLHRANGLIYRGDTLFSGIVVDRYAGGGTKSSTPYLAGRKQGVARAWYPDGTLMEERLYEAGQKEGTHCGWWENGRPRFRYTFRNDLHEGSAEEWFPDGSLYRSFNYAGGHEAGAQKMWNDDGSVQANYVVIDGRRYGSIGTKPCRSPR